MNLPTIHPLQNDPPRWAVGDENDPNRKCGCNWCRHWSPLLQHIEAQLNEEGKKLLNEYVTFVEQEIEDGHVAQAKLNGDWPGWEILKGFHPADLESFKRFYEKAHCSD